MSEPRVHNEMSGTVAGSVFQAGSVHVHVRLQRLVDTVGGDGLPEEQLVANLTRLVLEDPARLSTAFEPADANAAPLTWDLEKSVRLLALVEQRLSEHRVAQQAQAELTERVTEQLAQLQRQLIAVPPRSPGPCPYPGMRAFDEDEADWFFGREDLVGRLARRLPLQRGGKPLFVIGVSGAGKSSLLAAGLVPAVRRGEVPVAGSRDWPVVLTRPFRDLTGEGVLVVDQFEEIFSPDVDPAARQAFLKTIIELSRSVIVVAAVRADYYSACADEPLLADVFVDNQFPVGPMSEDELRLAIEKPAEAAGLVLEPRLTELVLEDFGAQPGALPLLGYALRKTWEQGRENTLTIAGYRAAGGVRGAVRKAAQEVYDGLTDHAPLRRLLLRLVAVGEGVEPARRRVRRSVLVDDEDTAEVLARLVEKRLVVVAEAEVEIIHDVVLKAWPQLANWLTEDTAALVVQRELSDAAALWREVGDDALYRGTRLRDAREWSARHDHRLGPLERDFLDTSRKTELTRKRRTGALVLGLVLLLVVAPGAGAVAWWQHGVALQERDAATSRSYAISAAAARDNDPRRALMLSLAAWQVSPTTQARDALLSSQASRYGGLVGTHDGDLWRVAISADGVVASGQFDGTVRLWKQGTEAAALTGAENGLSDLAFSPDGRTLVTAHTSDRTDEWTRVWDVATGKVIRTLPEPAGRLAFSADSRFLVTGIGDRVSVWDANTGAKVRALQGQASLVTSVAVSRDAAQVVTGGKDGVVRLWGAGDSATELARHENSVTGVAISPQRTIASSSMDFTVRLWDMTGKQLTALDTAGDAASNVVFSPDGGVVIAPAGMLVRRWNATTGSQLTPYAGHTGVVASAAYSPDGRTIVSASTDRTVLSWHVRSVFLGPFDNAVLGTAVSNRTLAISAGRTVQLWDLTSRNPLRRLDGHTGLVHTVMFNHDGTRLATASDDGTIRIWNVETGALERTIAVEGRRVVDVVFAPDGATVAAWVKAPMSLANLNQPVELHRWDVHSGEELAKTRYEGSGQPAGNLSFSPDGRILAVPLDNGHVQLRGAEDDTLIAELTGHAGQVVDTAFSPDGTVLATGGGDRTVRLWNVATRQQIGTPLIGHSGTVRAVAFSPDGRTLASAGSDEAVLRLWDVVKHEPFAVVSGHVGEFNDVAYSGDGRTVVTASTDGSVGVWDTDTTAVAGRLCASLTGGRPLADEWVDAGNPRDTAPRC